MYSPTFSLIEVKVSLWPTPISIVYSFVFPDSHRPRSRMSDREVFFFWNTYRRTKGEVIHNC